MIGAPVFWVSQNLSLLVCLGAAVGVWFLARAPATPKALLLVRWRRTRCVRRVRDGEALRYGIAPVPASVMGIMTASSGGIVQDVLAQQPSILLRPEVYVSAAALHAALNASLACLHTPPVTAAAIAGLLGFALRGAAIVWGLALPSFRAGPKHGP